MRPILVHDELIVVPGCGPLRLLPLVHRHWGRVHRVAGTLIEPAAVFRVQVGVQGRLALPQVVPLLLSGLVSLGLSLVLLSLLGLRSEVISRLKHVLPSADPCLEHFISPLHGLINDLELLLPLVRDTKAGHPSPVDLTGLLVIDIGPNVVVEVGLIDIHFVLVHAESLPLLDLGL